jgi:hypothetical protein
VKPIALHHSKEYTLLALNQNNDYATNEDELNEAEQDLLTEFDKVAAPVIAYLRSLPHPHFHVVITPTSADLLEGVVGFTQED